VGLSKVGTPISSSDWNHRKLRDDDSGTDSSGDFLGGLDTKSNVSFGVSNDNNGLETGTLTGTSLLLDGFDLYPSKTHARLDLNDVYLHDLILQLWKEEVHNLEFLDG
jgi:hypothetical protein